jgi:hypothetical protein
MRKKIHPAWRTFCSNAERPVLSKDCQPFVSGAFEGQGLGQNGAGCDKDSSRLKVTHWDGVG